VIRTSLSGVWAALRWPRAAQRRAAQQIAPVVEEVLFVVTGDCEIYEGFAMWFYAVLK